VVTNTYSIGFDIQLSETQQPVQNGRSRTFVHRLDHALKLA
jgi:hypothetical protein